MTPYRKPALSALRDDARRPFLSANAASPWVRIYRYLAVTIVAASMVVIFRRWFHVNQTTVALTFLILVLGVATRWRLAYSVYLSILCTIFYNFFFLPPIGKLTISDPQNWITLFAFLATSVLVSHLSANEHRQAELSEARREEVERLYEFSQQILLLEDPRGIARMAPSLIARVFPLRAVGLYLSDHDSVHYSDPHSVLMQNVDVKQVAQSPDTLRSTAADIRILPLTLGMRSVGAMAVSPGNFSDEMYEAIGSIVAIAWKPLTFSWRIRLRMPSASKLVITTGLPTSRYASVMYPMTWKNWPSIR